MPSDDEQKATPESAGPVMRITYGPIDPDRPGQCRAEGVPAARPFVDPAPLMKKIQAEAEPLWDASAKGMNSFVRVADVAEILCDAAAMQGPAPLAMSEEQIEAAITPYLSRVPKP